MDTETRQTAGMHGPAMVMQADTVQGLAVSADGLTLALGLHRATPGRRFQLTLRILDEHGHTVRDFDSPVRLHEVAAPGLRAGFPPLKTMAARDVPVWYVKGEAAMGSMIPDAWIPRLAARVGADHVLASGGIMVVDDAPGQLLFLIGGQQGRLVDLSQVDLQPILHGNRRHILPVLVVRAP